MPSPGNGDAAGSTGFAACPVSDATAASWSWAACADSAALPPDDFFLLKILNIRFTLSGNKLAFHHQPLRKPQMKKHTIRIVGGQYRRTPIPVPDVVGLRPTPDRVRETLFNWLAHFWDGDFSGKRVLDLFAGTGALGFEAASRGVDYVQMVESDPTAIAALRALRTRLDANQVRVHAGDALHVLGRLRSQPFDLVMLDPPFEHGWLDRIWQPVQTILSPGSLLYVETETPISLDPAFTLLRESKAGHVYFYLLRFDAMQKTDNNSVIPIQS